MTPAKGTKQSSKRPKIDPERYGCHVQWKDNRHSLTGWMEARLSEGHWERGDWLDNPWELVSHDHTWMSPCCVCLSMTVFVNRVCEGGWRRCVECTDCSNITWVGASLNVTCTDPVILHVYTLWECGKQMQ
jgi:hypothetical protein